MAPPERIAFPLGQLLRDRPDLLFQKGVVLSQALHQLQDLVHALFQQGHLIDGHGDGLSIHLDRRSVGTFTRRATGRVILGSNRQGSRRDSVNDHRRTSE
jgi:hypothetical protein